MNQQATELEEAIIGACLIEQEALPLVADKLRPEMFYDNRHQLIFACLTAMYQAGKKIDILTVKEELVHRGNLEEAGGAFAIAQLSSKVASSAHIEYHAQIVHQKYLAREAVLGFNKLLACAMDETMDIGDTLIDAHNLLDRLEGESGHQDHMRDMETLMADALKEAEDRIAKSVNGVTGIPTGLNELDKKTGGLQDGEMVVIAARPSVGKTAFALHLARSAASAGKAVAVYSLEMEGERLADRWLLAASNINPYRWRNGLANPQEVAEAHTTSGELSQLPIYVDDNSSVSMEHVRSSARLLKAKSLAKELHIPVVLLSQLNRESENRPGGRPELAHLRESGAIEQDADVVMLLYRPAQQRITIDKESGYPTEGLGVVIVAKQRNGETGNVYFGHNQSMTKIYDYIPPLEYMMKHAR